MIGSILDANRLDNDVRRENRAVRLKRYVTVFLGCAMLVGLGIASYNVIHTLSQ